MLTIVCIDPAYALVLTLAWNDYSMQPNQPSKREIKPLRVLVGVIVGLSLFGLGFWAHERFLPKGFWRARPPAIALDDLPEELDEPESPEKAGEPKRTMRGHRDG